MIPEDSWIIDTIQPEDEEIAVGNVNTPEMPRDFLYGAQSPPEEWDFFAQLKAVYKTKKQEPSEYDFIGGYDYTPMQINRTAAKTTCVDTHVIPMQDTDNIINTDLPLISSEMMPMIDYIPKNTDENKKVPDRPSTSVKERTCDICQEVFKLTALLDIHKGKSNLLLMVFPFFDNFRF